MDLYFEIYTGIDGKYYWRLAKNHVNDAGIQKKLIYATGNQGYNNKSVVYTDIDAVIYANSSTRIIDTSK